MSLNFNHSIIAGRMVKDPELKTTTTGKTVTSFTIAVNRRYAASDQERQADFIDCVAWREKADFITKYFRKGSAICVSGALQTRTYEDNSGNKRKACEIVVDTADFVESKSTSESNQSAGLPEPQPYRAPAPQSGSFDQDYRNFAQNKKQVAGVQQFYQPTFDDVPDDDDLPF